MATLSFVNIFAKDIKKLSNFYTGVFGFNELKNYRSPIFRAVHTGKCSIGINSLDAYALLNLKSQDKTKGVKFLLNFEARSMKEVDELTTRAVQRGARVIKEPYRTYYNWYQAVLLDPEENAFRINKVLPGDRRNFRK